MEGDAPANPALEHIVENLDLGHGHIGGGPDPEAVPRKGLPGPDAVASQGESILVAASSWNPCASAAAWEGPATPLSQIAASPAPVAPTMDWLARHPDQLSGNG